MFKTPLFVEVGQLYIIQKKTILKWGIIDLLSFFFIILMEFYLQILLSFILLSIFSLKLRIDFWNFTGKRAKMSSGSQWKPMCKWHFVSSAVKKLTISLLLNHFDSLFDPKICCDKALTKAKGLFLVSEFLHRAHCKIRLPK